MNNSKLYIGMPGRFETLEFRTVPRQAPAAGEIEVEVVAAGLNFKDVLIALGLLGAEAAAGPLGSEFAGRVVKVGPGVEGLREGDAVMGVGSGCVTSYATVAAEKTVKMPARTTFADAAGLPGVYLTAHFALERARLAEGESILIHAATGGVGLATVRMAQAVGAEIFATAGSEEKRAFLRQQGIRHVADSRSLAFVEEFRTASGGRGVDVVINSLAGEFLESSFALLAPHGRFVELGVRDMLENRALGLGRCLQGASFIAIGSGAGFPKTWTRLREIAAKVGSGELGVLPQVTFPAGEVGRAFEHMARAQHIGKIVIALRPEMEKAGRVPPGHENYLLPAEGAEVFRRVLASGRRQVAVSTVALAQRLRQTPQVTAQAPAETTKPHPRPKLRNEYVAPRTPVESALAACWRTFLGVERVGVEDDFFDMGGDSLLAVQLLTWVRDSMKAELPAHALAESPTIAKLAGLLESRVKGQRRLPKELVRLKSGDAVERPLFLFHPVGGQVYIYRDLANLLDDRLPVWGVQADPARDAATLESLAGDYLAAIRVVQTAGPYRLGGSSFGGTMAFAIAKQLLAAGATVELLAMMDAVAPSQCPAGDYDTPQIIAYLLGQAKPEERELKRLRLLSTEDQIRHFVGAGNGRVSLTVAEVRGFLDLWGSNLKLLKEYRAEPANVGAVFFGATVPDGMNRTDYHEGWVDLIPGLAVHQLADTHIGINLKPHVQRIADELMARLGKRG